MLFGRQAIKIFGFKRMVAMFVHSHLGRFRGLHRLMSVALGCLVASAAAVAQTPRATPTVAPGVSEAVREAYTGLDWTGRPLSAVTLRKEAGAALVEGRRNCARQFSGNERKDCLQTVEEDHRMMMERLKTRTAGR